MKTKNYKKFLSILRKIAKHFLFIKKQRPSRSESDCICDSIPEQKKTYKRKNKFNQGDIVAWTCENSRHRSIAVLQSDSSFYACLNYKAREDEQDRLWIVDDIPSDVELTAATEEEQRKLIIAICKENYQKD